MKTASASKIILLNICLMGVLIAVDQASKLWIRSHLALHDTIPLWEDVFHITHVQNTGAAFSILQGHKVLFMIVTSVVSGALIGLMLLKAKVWPRLLLISLAMIAAGGIGNLLDRIAQGYVTDLFDFRLIHFAVFNVADICIVCGAGLLMWYILVLESRQGKSDEANKHNS